VPPHASHRTTRRHKHVLCHTALQPLWRLPSRCASGREIVCVCVCVCEREREREREREVSLTIKKLRKVGKHNALSSNNAPGCTGSSICRRVLYPHSPFGQLARLCGHKGAQTSIGPSQSSSRSWRRRAPWDVPPRGGEGFGISNRSPDPLGLGFRV
jgi:hypothetical protein